MSTINIVGKAKKIIEGTITTPKGFQADGLYAGLKKAGKDLGVIISDVPCDIAAVYTQSHFQAPPLKVTQESIAAEKKLQAIVVNSKYANACTGEKGKDDAYAMRNEVANKFNLPKHYVAVASTGVIGEYIPMEKVIPGINQLQPSYEVNGAFGFQEAILTTDTCTKTTCYQVEINGKAVHIAGAAKGSGMIHPNMATMLGFVTTDAAIDSENLQAALGMITDQTFNRITVDGDTSTNDMVLVMANGLAQNDKLSPSHPDWDAFFETLQLVCEDLSKSIAKDGEGATKLIEVLVNGAINDKEAGIIAKQIVGSSLVKTAVYGSDANWGRIVGAIGYSNATVDPDKVDISIGSVQMFQNGGPIPFSEEEAKGYLDQETVVISVDLHLANGSGKAWGCDLTYDYVKINASYRT